MAINYILQQMEMNSKGGGTAPTQAQGTGEEEKSADGAADSK